MSKKSDQFVKNVQEKLDDVFANTIPFKEGKHVLKLTLTRQELWDILGVKYLRKVTQRNLLRKLNEIESVRKTLEGAQWSVEHDALLVYAASNRNAVVVIMFPTTFLTIRSTVKDKS